MLSALDPKVPVVPEGSVLFPDDVLVIRPGRDSRGVEPLIRGVSMAYIIEGYSGPASPPSGYQLASLDAARNKWTFSLPPGRMTVRVAALAGGASSDVSQPYKLEVKGICLALRGLCVLLLGLRTEGCGSWSLLLACRCRRRWRTLRDQVLCC